MRAYHLSLTVLDMVMIFISEISSLRDLILCESLQAGDPSAYDQGVDVLGALVGYHGF